jgi:GGDEF domain-containing protein
MLLFRYGGEEFAIFTRSLTYRRRSIAEKYVKSVADLLSILPLAAKCHGEYRGILAAPGQHHPQ